MSLTDVDKDSPDRGNPKPNHTDQIIDGATKAHGTNSTNYTTDATDTSTNQGIKFGFARLVKTGGANVINDGSTITTTTVAHGLGYVPLLIADLNNATVTTAVGSVTGASIALPLFTSAGIDSVNQQVKLGTWLYGFVDATNVYFNLLNATGSPVSVGVTFYLYQQQATG